MAHHDRCLLFFFATVRIFSRIAQIFYCGDHSFSRHSSLLMTAYDWWCQIGWGTAEDLRRILQLRRHAFSSRESCADALLSAPAPTIRLHRHRTVSDEVEVIDGSFRSPLALLMPGLLPPESEIAHFQAIIPKKKSSNSVCIQFAGTGDHFFYKRRVLLGLPLAREGIASIILENPFYGLRKPKDQFRSSLRHVTDLFVMGCALIMETAALFNWCEQEGFRHLGVTGFSMGGHMASLAASAFPKPLAVVPCMSASSASAVFVDGVLSSAVGWEALAEQVTQVDKIAQELNVPFDQPQSASDRTVALMRLFMDEATSLQNFFPPVSTSSTIVVVARHDAYIPLESAEAVSKLWPGCEVRYTDGGHLSSFLFKHDMFKDAILDAFSRLPK